MKYLKMLIKCTIYVALAVEGFFGNFGTRHTKDPWDKWLGEC